MTEATKEDLATFAGMLEEFAVAQRSAALGETKKQRITVSRRVGDMSIAYEMVVDEGSTSADIFDTLAPMDGAIDRLQAKASLSYNYTETANLCGQIEQAVAKTQADLEEFRRLNAKHSENRRIPRAAYTESQQATLNAHHKNIESFFKQIEGHREAISEAQRVLGGENPFAVLERQISKKLDQLRGARQDAA